MEEKPTEDNVIDDNGKIKFSRMKFDLELFESILANIKGFDIKSCKEKPEMIRSATEVER